MKFLLVVYLFTLNLDNNPKDMQVIVKHYDTIEECHFVGRNFREAVKLPNEVKSLSSCIQI